MHNICVSSLGNAACADIKHSGMLHKTCTVEVLVGFWRIKITKSVFNIYT